MKKIFLLMSFCFSAAAGHAQDRISVKFESAGGHVLVVNKAVLSKAKTLMEVIPGFPLMVNRENVEFLGAELTHTATGEIAASTGEVLTPEQHLLIHKAQMGAGILASVRYRFLDRNINRGNDITAEYAIVVGPDHDAEFPDGRDKLSKYFEETLLKLIPEELANINATNASVGFVVNASGEITGAYISHSSREPKLDNMLLEAITKMPKWIPAETAGRAFDQKVIVSVPFGKSKGC
jgi:TonB family protein